MISFKTSLLYSILVVLILFSTAMTVNISAQTANRIEYTDLWSGLGVEKEIRKQIIKEELTDPKNYAALLSPVPTMVLDLWDVGEFIILCIRHFCFWEPLIRNPY